MIIKKIYYFLYFTAIILRTNLKDDGDIFHKLKAAILGYELKAYNVYKKRYGKEYRACFTDRARLLKRELNDDYNLLMDNKLVNYKYFQDVKMPEIYRIIKEGIDIESLNRVSHKTIENIVGHYQEIIVKPVLGAGGVGVYFLKVKDDRIIVNHGSSSVEELIKDLQRGTWLITEYIQQAEYAQKLFPWSANTIRIITLNHQDDIKIVYAVHRFGSLKDSPTDNWSQGGISAKIDLKTGEIGSSIYDSEGNRLEEHPITQEKIKNVKIPHFDLIKEHIMQNHQKNFYIPMIAWDIVVTEDSFSVIEMNASSGVQIIQVHEPVYKIKWLNQYYE